MKFTRKTILFGALGLVVLGVGASIGLAVESTDMWTPTNTPFEVRSTNSSFTVGSIVVECAKFGLMGTTPAAAGELLLKDGTKTPYFADQTTIITEPLVKECKPNTTVVSGEWGLTLHSATCEKVIEEDDDCVTIKVPNEGAKIKTLGCEIKVEANTIIAPYDDETHTATFTEQSVLTESGGTNCLVKGKGIKAKFKGGFTVFYTKEGLETAEQLPLTDDV